MTRPINVLPQEREVINTQFILRTRETLNAVSQQLQEVFRMSEISFS